MSHINQKLSLIVTLLFSVTIVAASDAACARTPTDRLEVATSTSLLAYIVEQVGADNVDVLNIVPPSQHPGNFDARPGDVQKLTEARLFLVHGFPGETYVPGLVQAANNPNLQVVTISFSGSWMTPEAQLAAAEKVATALGEADPPNKDTYRQRSGQYQDRVRAKAADVKQRLTGADMASLRALSSVFQAPFVGWAGIKVVGTYSTPESLTPQAVKDLVDKGRSEGVTLVVDNIHSGPDAGKGLAEELRAKRVTLVYFPGGLPNTETWEKAIDYDVNALVEVARK